MIPMVLWLSPAWACSVCFSTTDANRQAFMDSTIFLTMLPLVVMGLGAHWLRRQYAA